MNAKQRRHCVYKHRQAECGNMAASMTCQLAVNWHTRASSQFMIPRSPAHILAFYVRYLYATVHLLPLVHATCDSNMSIPLVCYCVRVVLRTGTLRLSGGSGANHHQLGEILLVGREARRCGSGNHPPPTRKTHPSSHARTCIMRVHGVWQDVLATEQPFPPRAHRTRHRRRPQNLGTADVRLR